MHDSHISIWFFIGISLLVNGVLILGAGIYQVFVPPAQPTVLAQLHPGIWWGALMAILGGFYCFKFAPSKTRSSVRPEIKKATESRPVSIP
jgi:FtsH-binding integral membrane protein